MAKGNPYAYLSRITDPNIRNAVKVAMDLITQLQSGADGIGSVSKPLTDHMDGGGYRLQTIGDPGDDLDAVNFQTLKRYVDAAIARATPIDAEQRPGSPVPPTDFGTGESGGPGTPGGGPPLGGDTLDPLDTPTSLGSGPRFWRGDFAGIPGGPYGGANRFFTAFYPMYQPADREAYLADCQARGYTHIPISIASGNYSTGSGDPYPAFDLSTDPATFAGFMDEISAAGCFPVVFMTPDSNVIGGLNPGLSPSAAIGLLESWMAPFIANPIAMQKIQIAAIGWEVNGYLGETVIGPLCQWLRSLLGPNPILYAHFTPAHNAGEDPGSIWWASMQGVLNGILYQDNSRDGASLRTGCAELTIRFQNGLNGWPTDSGFGHPFDVVAFEYDAFWQVRGSPEAEGVAMGNTAMHCNPPIMGCGNGMSA